MHSYLIKYCVAFFFIIGLKCFAQETVVPKLDPNAPDFKFETELIDFGKVAYDANGLREFKFTNTGRSPLIITNVVGECGCTSTSIDGKPGWPTEPILPGKKGVIKIKYDTKRIGVFEKSITVSSNARFANKKIKIKGEILAQKS
jgi:hypothetical protein